MLRSVFGALAFAVAASLAMAGPIDEAIARAGDRLVADQLDESYGVWAGSWAEPGFTGPSVAGLAIGYELTGAASCRTAAEAGGEFILRESSYGQPNFEGFYGDGAYGLTCLSELSANPAANDWRDAVFYFYEDVRIWRGTQNYIDGWGGQEDTSAAYDIARHSVAAHYVNAVDKELWRTGLIDALGDVDDLDDAPVMALGVSVWALAQTGPMDGTLVDPSAAPGSQWDGVTLGDLPGMLASQQVSSGEEAGSFYTKFLHTLGGGYTETTAMGALGLIAAYEHDYGLAYTDEILSASLALAGGVGGDGSVYWRIGDDTEDRYYYLCGETLEAIPALPGDFDGDGDVDLVDIDSLFSHFGPTPPNEYDLTGNGPVDLDDVTVLVEVIIGTAYGDANVNRRVDDCDLSILLAFWGKQVTSWGSGDFNGDGYVTDSDLSLLLSNWGFGTGGGSSAPEPGTFCVLAAGGVLLLARRRAGHRGRQETA